MATIVTRAGKGSALTHTEMDANFTNLNTDKIEDLVDDTTPQLGGDLDFNSNKATLFESTGIDDNATSTAVTIDASENVGIGTTSPSCPLEVKKDGSQFYGTYYTALKALKGDGSKGLLFGYDTSEQTATITSNSTGLASSLAFKTYNGSTWGERVRIQSGGGISFNGDTAAANALDDYEEGTWTPTALNYDGTMTVNYADYTKIGRLVYATASVTYDGTADGSGISWGGVPFSLKVNGMGYQGGFIVHDSSGNLSSVSYRSTNGLYGRNSSGAIPSYTTVGAATVIFTVIFSTDS